LSKKAFSAVGNQAQKEDSLLGEAENVPHSSASNNQHFPPRRNWYWGFDSEFLVRPPIDEDKGVELTDEEAEAQVKAAVKDYNRHYKNWPPLEDQFQRQEYYSSFGPMPLQPVSATGDGDISLIQFARCHHWNDPIEWSGAKQNVWVLKSPEELKDFLHSHAELLDVVYGFVALCDIGSLQNWLGMEKFETDPKKQKWRVHAVRVGIQVRASVNASSAHVKIFDSQPLLHGMNIRSIADCGTIVGIPKLQKPDWLGFRNPETSQEWDELEKYGGQDAAITSRINAWLIEQQLADPQIYASPGTWASNEFKFPQRLEADSRSVKRRAFVPLEERLIKSCAFAGRSEVFVNGRTNNAYYNDCVSLYPVCISATNALLVDRVESIPENELTDYERAVPDSLRLTGELDGGKPLFGWLRGQFFVPPDHDLWGLPVRGSQRNYYMTGHFTGLYSTFDLAAAGAKIESVAGGYRPVYGNTNLKGHRKFVELTLKRLSGTLPAQEKAKYKAILNAASGKLGQVNPTPARTSNYPASGLLLGFSHAIMSDLFRKYQASPIGIDTDSIFGSSDFSGTKFDVNNGQDSFPVKMDLKDPGLGNLSFFRSKLYILRGVDNPDVFRAAIHSWPYFYEDYIAMFDGVVNNLETRTEIKHTILSKERAAEKLPLGHWTYSNTLYLERVELEDKLKADPKRIRENNNSYNLVRDSKNASSTAWNLDEYLAGGRSAEKDDPLGLVSRKIVR
jgi:hypothetical protein